MSEPVEKKELVQMDKRNGGNLEINFPFLPMCYNYNIYTKNFPKRLDHCSADHLHPPQSGVKGSCLVSVTHASISSCPEAALCLPFALAVERELTGNFPSDCFAGGRKGAETRLPVSSPLFRKAVTQTQMCTFVIQVGDSHINTKGQKYFSPLLNFYLVSLSYFSKYLMTPLPQFPVLTLHFSLDFL